ncbi:MAG: alpha/beta fold hydrolase [Candidatus Omnitrophota bacterium]|nr:alpha/beta fold hydrolase [Candidatus Omnitrophota bacterium]
MLVTMLSQGTLLTSDDCYINYLHYKNHHDKVVVVAHGFYNSKDAVMLENLAKSLLTEYDIFMFDFRGHGKSKGLFTWTSKESNDLNAVLDYLKSKYKKTGLIAFSMGGSTSINVLSKREGVDSLVCVSVPSDISKIDYQFWKLDWNGDLAYTLLTKEGRTGRGFRPGAFWLEKDKPIDNVGKIKIPILYIHGEKDWVVKPWHSKALYEKTTSRKKLVMIKDGPHAEYLMKSSSGEFIKEIKDWFSHTLEDAVEK